MLYKNIRIFTFSFGDTRVWTERDYSVKFREFIMLMYLFVDY